MKAVIQRVSLAQVVVDGKEVGSISQGLLILLGVLKGDNETDCHILGEKIPRLRIFEDEQGKMNRSLMDIAGQILVVSQFTLGADLKKGLRPSFEPAADPQTAEELYQKFLTELKQTGLIIQTGVFGAKMQVSLINDGPVTFILDTRAA
jgi:D-tyrosyl-tRNA(Tyr) deacylase